jgi:hypothetical protein
LAKTSGSGARVQVFQHQASATLSQASPAQNTWYTILDTTKNCRLYAVLVVIATTGEDLEVRITIDGQTITGAFSAGAGANYSVSMDEWDATNLQAANGRYMIWGSGGVLEGRSIKVEVRKTTAAGAGTLSGLVIYAKIP